MENNFPKKREYLKNPIDKDLFKMKYLCTWVEEPESEENRRELRYQKERNGVYQHR